jgi:hypothetical protein
MVQTTKNKKYTCDRCNEEVIAEAQVNNGKWPIWFEIGKVVVIPILTSLFIYFGAFSRMEETVRQVVQTVNRHDAQLVEHSKAINILATLSETDRQDMLDMKVIINTVAERQLQVLIKLGVTTMSGMTTIPSTPSPKRIEKIKPLTEDGGILMR